MWTGRPYSYKGSWWDCDMVDYVGSSAGEVASPQEAVEIVEGNWLGLVCHWTVNFKGKKRKCP